MTRGSSARDVEPTQVAVIGYRQCRLSVTGRRRKEVVRPRNGISHAVRGVGVQVHERLGHRTSMYRDRI